MELNWWEGSPRGKLYGLCGVAGAGKDTAYQMLPKNFAKRVAFADSLKQDLQGCVNSLYKHIPDFDINNQEHKNKFRPLWVLWSQIAKQFDPMIWVKRAAATIHKFPRDAIVVITDVRYDFEVKWIREQGGEVFYIERLNFGPANAEEAMSFMAIDHSYAELMEHPIHNNGAKEYLGRELLTRIEAHLKKSLTTPG